MPKTIEKWPFQARQDAGSCCAIREFLLRIVGPKRPAKGFSQISFEGRNTERTSPCAAPQSESSPGTEIAKMCRISRLCAIAAAALTQPRICKNAQSRIKKQGGKRKNE